jgi:hypothetical protein
MQSFSKYIYFILITSIISFLFVGCSLKSIHKIDLDNQFIVEVVKEKISINQIDKTFIDSYTFRPTITNVNDLIFSFEESFKIKTNNCYQKSCTPTFINSSILYHFKLNKTIDTLQNISFDTLIYKDTYYKKYSIENGILSNIPKKNTSVENTFFSFKNNNNKLLIYSHKYINHLNENIQLSFYFKKLY